MKSRLASKTFLAFVLAATLSLSAAPAGAHHSGAMFDTAHLIPLTGVATTVEWTNPHTFLCVNVNEDQGVIEEWAIEIDGPNFLRHNGWTSSTVSAGEKRLEVVHPMTVELPSGVQVRC